MLQAIVLLGISSLMHFSYDFFPNSLLALIVPINESIFQHIKILFYPILLYFLHYRKISTIVFVQIVSILLMLFMYYFYRYALNVESVFIDILLLFIIFLLVPKLEKIALIHKWTTSNLLSISFICIMIFLLGYFTIYPPSLPMFIQGNPIS